MFPDDVKRLKYPDARTKEIWVRASDYDKLLAMYRKAVKLPTVEEKSIALRRSLANLRGDEIITNFMRERINALTDSNQLT